MPNHLGHRDLLSIYADSVYRTYFISVVPANVHIYTTQKTGHSNLLESKGRLQKPLEEEA